MALTPDQLSEARALRRGGALLREIAAALGVAFEAVCLGLYGDNSWPGQTDIPEASGTAREAPGSPAPEPAATPVREASTAARMDGHDRKMGAEGAAAPEVEATAPPETLGHASPTPAGTQAPPVDISVARDERRSGGLFKLRNGYGEYLHERGRGMTRLSQFMWRGTADEVRVLQKRHSHLAELEPVPVLGS
jgi:hypothetical protein